MENENIENIQEKINLIKKRIESKKITIAYWKRMLQEEEVDLDTLEKAFIEYQALIDEGKEHE